MEKLRRLLARGREEHLSDDRLASLFSDELTRPARLAAQRHLARCLQCRARQTRLEDWQTERMVHLYSEALEHEEVLPPLPAAEFTRRLRQKIRQAPPPRPRWRPLFPMIALPELPTMDPTLAIGVVLAFAAVVSLFVWGRQRTPNITSNTLLVRAENWDDASMASSGGVIYQEVRITTPRVTLDRAIYRDARGRRRPKTVRLNESEEQLKNRLSVAGVNWEAPLLATSYQDWHDHQRIRADKIKRSGKRLLTLTTTTPVGDVAEETLTVRDTDFHPVSRSVEFRNKETVEIAELDFKILPWSSVGPNVFEPVAVFDTAAVPSRVIPFPPPPEVLTPEQLDEAELGARLVLNQLHADTGKQIEFERSPQGVEVKGVVDTEEQKRELQQHLLMLPHVTASIQCVADLQNGHNSDAQAASIRTAEMPDQPSPLELFLLKRGRSVSTINGLAQQLFSNALTISQESKAIADLQARFAPDSQQTVLASATLTELIFSHRDRLRAALNQERELLAEAQSGPASGEGAPLPEPFSLMAAARRNMDLCRELTATSGGATRTAEMILADMSVSLDELTVDARAVNGNLQSDAALKAKQ
ncbi:anti-sigma factor family protein [Paracidobacterium acidisoli]|uniref:Zinc-finger domain-containing protein n=1 Tax=Paracidobacterium acidisoli TaxID=2303751 RepID=A0A372IQP2_9BACT|nr:hypothetical protein [Paracidobacterium acidisoli]MBT9331576.1 hypothetical protein [Paracidobacterium acidisoli]